MKRICLTLLALLTLTSQAFAQDPVDPSDTLFQVSTLGVLLVGGFDGVVSFADLPAYGDFGVGTFDKIDGEMIALDGEFYQITSDGVAKVADPSLTTPFAAITFFEADQTLTFDEPLACPDLYAHLDTIRPSANLLYAIKITGEWAYLKTRSPLPQAEPYPPLADALVNQAEFEFESVEATLAGFWLPTYMSDLNSAGYHFHAITADLSAGGHVLDCQVGNVTIELDYTDQFQMVLPDTEAFLNELDLAN